MQKISLPKHIPALDGLRGIAILAVMFYHLKMPGFRLGWVGVNLFFLISGFLITGILLDTKESSRYFKNFYIRRVLRIFPAYYLTLIGIWILWNIQAAYGNKSAAVYSDWPYFFLFFQNYILGLKAFNADFPRIAYHTWSLALEEQFYLIWPAVVYFLNRKTLVKTLFGLFFFSMGARLVVWFLTHNASLVQISLFTQFDGLAAGAFLAILTRSTQEDISKIVMSARVLGIISLGLIIFSLNTSIFGVSLDHPPYILFPSLLAVSFGATLIEIILNKGYLARMMQNPALKYVGKISYGLYLYHYPVFYLTRQLLLVAKMDETNFWIQVCMKLGITFLLAAFSWRMIERPLLTLKDRWAAPIVGNPEYNQV